MKSPPGVRAHNASQIGILTGARLTLWHDKHGERQ